MGYKVGDMVVYPRHGAAKVEAITGTDSQGNHPQISAAVGAFV